MPPRASNRPISRLSRSIVLFASSMSDSARRSKARNSMFSCSYGFKRSTSASSWLIRTVNMLTCSRAVVANECSTYVGGRLPRWPFCKLAYISSCGRRAFVSSATYASTFKSSSVNDRWRLAGGVAMSDRNSAYNEHHALMLVDEKPSISTVCAMLYNIRSLYQTAPPYRKIWVMTCDKSDGDSTAAACFRYNAHSAGLHNARIFYE